MKNIVVVTRTKDRPVFLKRAIKSVSNQTFTNFTHVIVNDGGDKDEVEAVVMGFDKSVRDKIKVFHRGKSSGAPDTIFNESIDRINSDYFAIHDDDDTWNPRFLELTVAKLDRDKSLGAVVARCERVTEKVDDNGEIRQLRSKPWMSNFGVVSLYRQCSWDNQLTPIATLYRRSAYESVGKFDSSLPIIGDWEFALRLLMKYDVGFIDPGRALAFYSKRVKAENSFDMHNHRYWMHKIADRYLREELAVGKLGIGFIISQNINGKSAMKEVVERVVPSNLARKLRSRFS
jgi:glycosyltransferase involved in cell wall biosynthesis